MFLLKRLCLHIDGLWPNQWQWLHLPQHWSVTWADWQLSHHLLSLATLASLFPLSYHNEASVSFIWLLSESILPSDLVDRISVAIFAMVWSLYSKNRWVKNTGPVISSYSTNLNCSSRFIRKSKWLAPFLFTLKRAILLLWTGFLRLVQYVCNDCIQILGFSQGQPTSWSKKRLYVHEDVPSLCYTESCFNIHS